MKNRLISPLLLALLLSGCGLTQSVSDGTKSVAKSIFYKQVKTLHLDFVARAELNPDDDGTPLATNVWVYQLKEPQAFEKADYTTLLSNASNVLKADLLAEKDVWIRPGSNASVTMPMEENAQFLAIVAQFRTPDNQKGSWRIILKRNELDPDKARVIELEKSAMRLLTADK
ncbi:MULTISPECIES: type VI secretion system lipoprotein TssJ [unclassified Serratia (in: enterobacteria)]|uniref:type VI secretion system lipoprotein TssJ n=1 Tax=unclassified Serratia (in: enterobacteria) TaxID=2647522 RepID=UPI00307666FB